MNILRPIVQRIKSSGYTIEAIFKQFDLRDKGALDFETFSEVMRKLAPHLMGADIRQIFELIDSSGDGYISLEEFAQVFFNSDVPPLT